MDKFKTLPIGLLLHNPYSSTRWHCIGTLGVCHVFRSGNASICSGLDTETLSVGLLEIFKYIRFFDFIDCQL